MKRAEWMALWIALAGAGGYLGWRYAYQPAEEEEFALYGNVDLRQVELAFNNSERIKAVLVQEGERVQRGQVLARLDTSRLEPQVAQAEAQVEAGRHLVQRLHNGTRPEEIAQARANLEAAKAEASRTRKQYERLKSLSERSDGRAVSDQNLENASAALQVAEANVAVAQKLLDLALAGPRKEDIAEAEAKLRAGEAQLAYLRQIVKDTELLAPDNAVVRTRITEPGEIAFPQKPVLSLAITDPKWVRAYVSEIHLGKLRPGMPVFVTVDSFPARRFDAWVGFISPVAEFTPKTVQTEDLRTSLVYEVRVFVKDPEDELRLGMPATVRLPVENNTRSAKASPPTGTPLAPPTATGVSAAESGR